MIGVTHAKLTGRLGVAGGRDTDRADPVCGHTD